MTRLIFTRNALADIERLVDVLSPTLEVEANKTAGVIAGGLEILLTHPAVGRPVRNKLRELVISRGATGYVALYRFDANADLVVVLALRHQREAGYATAI